MRLKSTWGFMRLKVADLIGFATLLMGALYYMRAKKKTVATAVFVIGAVILVASYFSGSDAPSVSTTQTTSSKGNNSPAQSQSATASGNNSTVTQAGRDIVNKHGYSAEEMLPLLQSAMVDQANVILAKYPNGAALFGVIDGRSLIGSPVAGSSNIVADWKSSWIDRNTNNNTVAIELKHLRLPGEIILQNCSITNISYVKGRSVPISIMPIIPTFYCEVLDDHRGIFVLGLK